MSFGALLIGQTVPQNFFKKLFSPQKVSVVKDSVRIKKNSPHKAVIKIPVVVEEEKVLGPTITCPTPNPQTVCLTSGTTYTNNVGLIPNAAATDDGVCTGTVNLTLLHRVLLQLYQIKL